MKRFDSINVIPFIDIMLVLLAIVLTTASFIAQGKLKINLSESNAQVSLEQQIGAEIAINSDQAIFLDEVLVDLNQLNERLLALNPMTPITLRIDRSVPFERFITVVDLLKENKFESLSILTREGV